MQLTVHDDKGLWGKSGKETNASKSKFFKYISMSMGKMRVSTIIE